MGFTGTRGVGRGHFKSVPWGQLAEASMGWVRSKRNVGVGIKGGVAQVWLWRASRFVARSGCKEQQSLRSPTYLCLRPASQGLSRAFTISCPKANAQKAGCRKYVEKDLGGEIVINVQKEESSTEG